MTLLLLALASAADLTPPCASLGPADPPLERRCRKTLREASALGTDLDQLVRAAVTAPRAHAPATPEGVSLQVLTWNVGLLWFLGGYSVPGGDARRTEVARTLGELMHSPTGPDVVMLQELYRDEDQALVREAVGDAAVVLDARTDPGDWTGLLLLVRRDRLADPAPVPSFLPLQGDAFERAGFPRGILWADLELADGPLVRVGDVHLSPTDRADLSWRRTQQTLELADALVDPSAGWHCDGCTRVLGGDFNLGPDWHWDHTEPGSVPDGRRHRLERWLRWDGVLFDILATAAHDATARDTGNSLVATNPLWADYRWAQGEPCRRVDHVFVHGGAVARSAITLTEPGDAVPVLSDHYGVLTEVVVPVPAP